MATEDGFFDVGVDRVREPVFRETRGRRPFWALLF
jgi:hypothetical protein